MRHFILLMFGVAASLAAQAADSPLQVTVEGMRAGQPIAPKYALCTPTHDGKSSKVSAPLRPTIRWSGAPKGNDSFAVFVMDPDVPADFTDAGKEGKILKADSKRQNFFHYGVVGISAKATQLAGSSANEAPADGTPLLNDLGANHYVDPQSAYGGPCPPWNDARLHHYHFIVLALDKEAPAIADARMRAGAPASADPMTAKNTFDRLIASPHVLARGEVIGTYTLNPTMRKAVK